jgi:hypothetical protein
MEMPVGEMLRIQVPDCCRKGIWELVPGWDRCAGEWTLGLSGKMMMFKWNKLAFSNFLKKCNLIFATLRICILNIPRIKSMPEGDMQGVDRRGIFERHPVPQELLNSFLTNPPPILVESVRLHCP